VRDFAETDGHRIITDSIADAALARLDVDKIGLDGNDYKYLKFIAEHYNGGPVGVETIAAAMAEERDAIEDTIEPYLIQIGFIQRTPRGRMLTAEAMRHIAGECNKDL